MNSFLDKVKFSDFYCSLNGEEPVKMREKRLNLYVKIADVCNSNCPFCEYHGKNNYFGFNFPKFNSILNELVSNNIFINKVSFTGGEPTTDLPLLSKCIDSVARIKYKPFIVVNTNGYKIHWLSLNKNINSISLSRHRIEDIDHFETMGTLSVPTSNYIQFINDHRIHLTCNLMKGGVYDEDSIIEYLEYASSLGIYDVGFVSLMKINQFCINNHIDFDNIKFTSDNIICNKDWVDSDICKCKNYLYLPRRGNRVIKFYSRYRCKNESASKGNLVFDGEYLRDNFGAEILY